jgi:hypothetical protein
VLFETIEVNVHRGTSQALLYALLIGAIDIETIGVAALQKEDRHLFYRQPFCKKDAGATVRNVAPRSCQT